MHVPKAGDRYRVVVPFDTLAKVSYDFGDVLELIEPTGQAPWGIKSRICNWVVKCKHFTPPAPETVWSNIWQMIDHGIIEYMEPSDD